MSMRELKRPLKAYARDPRRKKLYLDVDLNDAPMYENREFEGTSSNINSRYEEASSTNSDGRLLDAPIDVEALDDEIIISSPRSFAAARNQSRRGNNNQNQNSNIVTVVLDDELDPQPGLSEIAMEEEVTALTLYGFRNHGLPSNRSVSELVTNIDKQKEVVPAPSPPRPAVPKEPEFTCPICMGPLVEEHSTTCGHIFCKKCIKAAIAAKKKCPACRRNLKSNSIHRVYLPTTN